MATTTEAADYRGEDVVGRRFRRAYRVMITNPYGGVGGQVTMDEEQVTLIEGGVTAKPTATLVMPVNLEAPIDLYDPSTGQPLGTQSSQLEVYVILYSVYRAMAAQRDAAEAAAAAAAAQRAAETEGLTGQ